MSGNFDSFVKYAKVFVVVVMTTISCTIAGWKFMKNMVSEAVEVAVSKAIDDLRSDIKSIKPIIEKHQTEISVLTYRIGIMEKNVSMCMPKISKDIEKPEEFLGIYQEKERQENNKR